MPGSAASISIVPPLKWAGGKRWFVQKYLHLLPESYRRYFEPFFGSGALFFGLCPSKARLSDLNAELINLYSVIRDQPEDLAEKLRIHHRRHSDAYYYEMRLRKPRSPLGWAARTLYLNRTCWNGLYRVNLRGEFNVPRGTKHSVILPSDNFVGLSKVLAGAVLACCDFEESLDAASAGDFAFIDPPYTVAHNNNGFVKYNQHLFRWEDQVRLRDAVVRAANRGVKVLVTNAAHKSVEELYSDFDVTHVERSGVIAGSSDARGRYREMVARWY